MILSLVDKFSSPKNISLSIICLLGTVDSGHTLIQAYNMSCVDWVGWKNVIMSLPQCKCGMKNIR